MYRLVVAGISPLLIPGALAVAEAQPAGADRSSDPLLIGTADIVRPADYPREAIRRKQEGQLWFRLDVDARGRITGCTVLKSSGHALLDRAACDVYRRRARYKPAREPSGGPRAGTDQRSVIWRIVTTGPEALDVAGPRLMDGGSLIRAEDYPAPAIDRLEQGEVTALLQIDAEGSAQSCTVEQSSKSASLDDRTCELLFSRGRFTPARDEQGRALQGEFRQKIAWRFEAPETFDVLSRMTASFDAAGKVASCELVVQTARQAAQAQPCPAGTPPPLSAEMIGKVANGRAAVIIEQMIIVREGAIEPLAQLKQGERLLREHEMKVSLDEQGEVTGCELVTAAGNEPPCPPGLESMAPVRVDKMPVAATITIQRREYLRFANPADAGPRLTNVSDLVTEDDYPVEAVNAEEEGRVGIRVGVNAQGRVTSCSVASSSGSASLDKATCALVSGRARYEPARDSEGRPVESEDQRVITWRLEGADFPFAEWVDRTSVSTAPYRCQREFEGALAGKSVDCTAEMPALRERPPGSSLSEASARLVIETRFLPRALRPGELGEPDARKTLSRQVLNLTIAPNGELVSCVLAELGPGYSRDDACSFAEGSYEVPEPQPGHEGRNRPATMIITVTVEAEQVT